MRPGSLSQFLTLVRKDLRREVRTREVTLTTIAFAILLVLVFAFSFYHTQQLVSRVFPGILWVSILFTGTLTVSRTFAQEKESECLRALAMIPGIHRSLYAAKLCVNLLFIVLFELVIVPLLLLTFDLNPAPVWGPLLASLGAGTLGFGALGTVLSAMLVHHRLREALLPVLLYPLLIPLLIASVKSGALMLEHLILLEKVAAGAATQAALDKNMEGIWWWIRMAAGVDLVFLVLSQALFRWVMEAVE